jgi:hypothetical protein
MRILGEPPMREVEQLRELKAGPKRTRSPLTAETKWRDTKMPLPFDK